MGGGGSQAYQMKKEKAEISCLMLPIVKLRRHGKLESQSQILSINKNGFFYFQMFRNSKVFSKTPQR